MGKPFIIMLCFVTVLAPLCTRAFGLANSVSSKGTNALAVHGKGEIGADVNIGLIAGRNVYTQHYAFFDKDPNGDNIGSTHAFNLDYSDNGISPFIHDTWMTGIAISRGSVSHPNDIGVAPGANVYCARIADNNDHFVQSWFDGTKSAANGALDELINAYNCRVIMTGIAFQLTPDGKSYLTLMYDYYADTYDVIFTPGAGNGDSEIFVFGDMYNGISVGGLTKTQEIYGRVGEDSSSGPTTHDRNKPDVVAPAQKQYMPHVSPDSWKYWNESPEGATSLSGPHAAGVAALLLGLADDSNEPNDSRSEVIRAVIVNSTFPNINNKQGQSTNPLDPNNIWHGDRGYGRIDALRAYELLDSNRVSRTSIISQDKGWAYENISNSDTHNYLITATKNYRLVLTTTWNRKPTRSWNRVWGKYVYSDEVIPKFDIDVTVKDPNGAEIFSTPDNSPLYEFPNNLEKIDLLLLKDGQYEIIVENTSSKSRDYGMAFELIPPLTADFNHDYVVDTNDLSVLTDDWLETGSQADLAGQDDVDLKDFAVFAANWRNINSLYH